MPITAEDLSRVPDDSPVWDNLGQLADLASAQGVEQKTHLRKDAYLWHLAACLDAGVSSIGMRVDAAIRHHATPQHLALKVPIDPMDIQVQNYLVEKYKISQDAAAKILGKLQQFPRKKIDKKMFADEHNIPISWLNKGGHPEPTNWIVPYMVAYSKNIAPIIDAISALSDFELDRKKFCRFMSIRIDGGAEKEWNYFKYLDVCWDVYLSTKNHQAKFTFTLQELSILYHLAAGSKDLDLMPDESGHEVIKKINDTHRQLLAMQGNAALKALANSSRNSTPAAVFLDLISAKNAKRVKYNTRK